ncbi:tyrosine-type recombinase/integrase [Candidatus Magnetaquicoccus inordinatus]|uniref:tyrosine-type recombinase/integrase n=1 Tax=Candidatus Magnetaquicoccus inordinatus TaxID=2496818 RepID=UPI00102AAF3D|nr:site-specific integrase [Candidatus Magnetaquicoccus inordinatus]
MARKPPGQLTALKVTKTRTPGLYGDGGNLWLQVTSQAAKSWVLRYTLRGKNREMGLGSVQDVSLEEARTKAAKARKLLIERVDPIVDRDIERQKAAPAKSFKQCADEFIEANKAGWSNTKHAAQWASTLETYAYPIIGTMPVSEVTTDHVLQILNPIWQEKPETASRVKGRIESVLSMATVRGYRIGENPARWKGHLDQLLPAKVKVAKVEHHAALPYADVSGFMRALAQQEGVAALALAFCILTATRTSETLGAVWGEIDFAAKVWAIPGDRMKAGREHRVPLSDQAMTVLERMQEQRQPDYIFPGMRAGRPLSNMALLMTLRRMERGDLTTHGFRSTFRDWAAETTGYPNEVCEMALAHDVKGVEGAYRRGDLFEKRRQLMADWGRYCDGK